MTAFDRDLPAVPRIDERPQQGIRDSARSDHYRNEVAQRHRRRSRLSAVPDDPSIPSDREFDVTSALTLPTAASWRRPGRRRHRDPSPCPASWTTFSRSGYRG